jgi:hypothetical protein
LRLRKEDSMKRISVAVTALALAISATASAQPTPGPEPGPGCFGKWRAGSVQVLTDAGFVVGRDFFSQRAGENEEINADNRATCDAISVLLGPSL